MSTRTARRKLPAIFWGAAVLAALSIAWSAYAITDLMKSGIFGLSVALAGDIGWITVLWAEAKRFGPRWAAPLAGWVIAFGVGLLLVIHGVEAHSTAQAIAGPFVVLVGKVVWSFALAALRDPAALTPEQEAEIHSVMRDSEHAARLHEARRDQEQRRAEATIERIQQQARITAARDRADFDITLERLEMRAEIERQSPMALGLTAGAEQIAISSSTLPSTASTPPAVQPMTSPNPDREQPSIADLAREQTAITTSNADAIRAVMTLRPDAEKESVAAAVRRARRAGGMKGGYG